MRLSIGLAAATSAILFAHPSLGAEVVSISPVYSAGETLKIVWSCTDEIRPLVDGVPQSPSFSDEDRYESTVKFLSVGNDGAEAEYVCDRVMKTPVDVNGTAFDSSVDKIDSGKRPESATLIGEKLTLHFTRDFSVDKVGGPTEVIAKMKAIHPIASPEFDPLVQTCAMFMLLGAATPGKGVEVGTVWNHDSEQTGRIVSGSRRWSSGSKQYKIEGISTDGGRRLAKITFKSESDWSSAAVSSSYREVSKGGSSGAYYFDLDAKLFVKGECTCSSNVSSTENGVQKKEQINSNTAYEITLVKPSIDPEKR